jgi:hypothetical protein
MQTIEQKASTEQSIVWRVSNESRLDRIARRAREIYKARGGRNGKALEDWLAAEREIDSASDH